MGKSILKFIRPSANSLFNSHNPKEIKFITSLRLGLSHLHEHKFKHNFQYSFKSFNSGLDNNCALSFSLPHVYYINNNLLDLSENVLIKTLLFGNKSFDTNANKNVLDATIEHVLSTKRFEKLLFQCNQEILKQGY